MKDTAKPSPGVRTPQRHHRVLELDKILELCASFGVSQGAKDRIRALAPQPTFAAASHALALTKDAHSLTNDFGNPGFYHLVPCDESVKRARIGGALSMKELLEVAGILRSTRTILTWYKQANDPENSLNPLFQALLPEPSLEKAITDAIVSEDEMSDTASPELADIRRKIRSANTRARESLEHMVRSSHYEKYLQEQIITIRNGRFVVPVRSEHKGDVKGLVHDVSGTGSTLFIEPMAVVELNNQIKELEAAQQNEIHRILLVFSGRVSSFGTSLTSNYDVLMELDAIFARAKLADHMLAGVPELIAEGETYLKKARHPLIPRDEVVPIDISIGGAFDTLVITGPNTGGKTVALKTLGLLSLMTFCGLMIPVADGSRVCFYEKVLADIGDEQSIEQSLSTFSSHMTNIVSILKEADTHSLILIDELGAGTDPVEGAALAVAIIDTLRLQGAKIVATTHYPEIKMYALQTDGVENASCEFNVTTLRPTYRLLIGTLGKSNAFAISEQLGLPRAVISAAEALVSTDNKQFETVVSSLEEARQALEQEQSSAQVLRAAAEQTKAEAEALQKEKEKEMQNELKKARAKAQSIVAQVQFQYDEVMKELDALRREQREDGGSTAAARRNLSKQLRQMEDTANPSIPRMEESYVLPRALVQGDVVFLTGFNTRGTVLSAPDSKGNLRVRAGILETKVPLQSVRLIEESKVTFEHSRGASFAKRAKSNKETSGTSELDLRGMDSSESLLELERFIDSAVLSNMSFISVIHGKGTGVLRRTVQEYLKRHPSIETFRLGEHGEGDSGVTIAKLH